MEDKPSPPRDRAVRADAGRTPRRAAARGSAAKNQDSPVGGGRTIRYAVVGLGYIAQIAMLPAFAHAKSNSELVALVSGDPVKLKKLGRRYQVPRTASYAEYNALLAEGGIDAVYIALPNHLHLEYTVRAARAGVHVLCEKPMAVTPAQGEQMIAECARHRVRLMIAYRLHFDPANLAAIEAARSGELGSPRIFNSLFTMQVRDPHNIRLRRETGGGSLHDVGIYCINAARYLFGSEPLEVFAMAANNGQKRFAEVGEMVSAMLRFPGERLANFSCSFGAADVSAFELVGTKGRLQLERAYELADAMKQRLTVDGRPRERVFSKHDQFAPQLIHFSDCILGHREPEPDGAEGLIDLQIIEALYRSASSARPVSLPELIKSRSPSPRQAMDCPAIRKPELVRAKSPSA